MYMFSRLIFGHEFSGDVCCVIGLTYYGKFSNYNIYSQCTNLLYICLQSCITLVSCLLHVVTNITHQCCFIYFSITITFKISMHFLSSNECFEIVFLPLCMWLIAIYYLPI